MIRRYRIGEPINTDSVVEQIKITTGEIPGWRKNQETRSLTFQLNDSDVVYGLGESIRGMNKRGWIYESNNSDDPIHTEDKHSLYASQNFLLVTSPERSVAVYIDTPGRVCFDIGYTAPSEMSITFDDFDADIYVIDGESRLDTVRQFRKLIGRSYIPPKWAFGYGQSRWSYMSVEEVRNVVNTYRSEEIPIDSVYLDIDYMDHYKDFTIDEDRFPDFADFTKEMKDDGVHLVPIIDAGVKIEDGYDVCEEGVEKDYFCKKENGKNLVAAVWPGKVYFPDFLNADVRKWFGNKYDFLLSKGIDGFWNDMNEPAIFYTEDHLSEVFEKIDTYKGRNLDIRSFFEFKDLVGAIDNNPEDYRRFYHDCNGQKVRHDKVHNIFGYNMTRAAGDAFRRLCPNKRILMFSRASYVGMHRYGGVWTGDNKSWWSHMLVSLKQQPALNMCGFMYSGSDIGGFTGDCTEDLMMRWLELAMFIPLYRNHSAEGTRRQELYCFGHQDWFRNIVQLRYALIPYIYGEFMKALLSDDMYMMPLSFVYADDKRAIEIEDQVLVGESVMVAPVYLQNSTGRSVYLPEDMKLVRFRSFDDYDEEVLVAGDHYIECALNETIVFVRKGHVMPLCAPAKCVNELDYSTIKYICFDAEPSEYELYNDDGLESITI
ncbi:MAG: alpha-glucosidase [Clostridiales bacterium]|nr:alpha-glucosidase [Clostridiales bacterium]